MRKLFTIAIAILFSSTMFAQTIVTGNVKDANSGEPLPGVNIKVVGKSLGTSTDFDGNYTLKVNQEPPFDIVITTLGYGSQTLNITSKTQTSDISLSENASSLDEVVVSASRTPESVRESPVTIERMDARDIRNTASASFYNSIENLKGVDVNTSSLTFNSVNTRGFATFANTRFVQLIDGMDNASPALNFVMGNLVGINELDVQSVELLPGASSALYGANAFNGILFMTSKNPFDDQGISAYIKKGITSSDAGGDDAYTDFGVRAAHAFSEKFAAKASFSYLKGTDWVANDTNHYSDTNLAGIADDISPFGSSRIHDGLNIYGDEIKLDAILKGFNVPIGSRDLQTFAGLMANGTIPGLTPTQQAQFSAALPLIPKHNVGFTGYNEQDLTDYEAKSIKTDVSLNYRPFGNDLELIGNYRIGFGNTIYQGANRYQLKDFVMQQIKFELRNKDFFLRAYKTSENAGNSYDMRFTGINMGKLFAGNWFGTYTGAYVQGIGQAIANSLDPNDPAVQDQLHSSARDAANAFALPQSGSDDFVNAFNTVTSDADVATGSKFRDNTSMKVGEGNYNFKSLLNDAIDLQVGGNYRQYRLDSGGTIFTDSDANGGAIKYNEYGAYIQAIKKLMDDRLKLAASVRIDKNEFFDAALSPRVSINYAAGDTKQHNFRASFQTGFRNPTTQDLFIGFNVGRAILVGSSPDNLDRDLPGTPLTGRNAYEDAYSPSSFVTFAQDVGAYTQTQEFIDDVTTLIIGSGGSLSQEQAGGLAVINHSGSLLESTVTDLVQPEKVSAIDVGYRGKLGKISLDINGYYNIYDGFISLKTVLAPVNGSALDGSGIADILAVLPEFAPGGSNSFDADFIQPFQTYTNSKTDVTSYGGVIGLSTRLGSGYRIGLNYAYSKFDFDQDKDPDFKAGYNTPEHKVKFSLGNNNVFKNFGFNINGRWSDEFLWESSIANALVDSRFTADAQLNYSMPKWKSMFKIGGTNLGGEDYRSAVGAGNVGSQYYVSWTINP